MMPVRTKTYKEFKKLICAMNAKNDEEVVKTLNQWKIEAYYILKRNQDILQEIPDDSDSVSLYRRLLNSVNLKWKSNFSERPHKEHRY